jgi:hypothetical protein
MPSLKTINYRGGVVRFRIPSGWVEEYEEEGGGTFYEPGDDTGTLRIGIITAELPRGRNVQASLYDLMSSTAKKYGQPVVPLPNRVTMLRYDIVSVDQGQRIKMRNWQLAHPLPAQQARHALFTYTLKETQFDQPRFAEELLILDREIAACEFANVLGR